LQVKCQLGPTSLTSETRLARVLEHPLDATEAVRHLLALEVHPLAK
jgi:hypothetical protein